MFPPLPGSIAHTISQLPNQIRRREKLREILKIKKVHAFDLPFLKSTAALVSSSNQISSNHLLVGLANMYHRCFSSLLRKLPFHMGELIALPMSFRYWLSNYQKRSLFMGTFPLFLVPPFNPSNTLYMPGPGDLRNTSRNSTKIGAILRWSSTALGISEKHAQYNHNHISEITKQKWQVPNFTHLILSPSISLSQLLFVLQSRRKSQRFMNVKFQAK